MNEDNSATFSLPFLSMCIPARRECGYSYDQPEKFPEQALLSSYKPCYYSAFLFRKKIRMEEKDSQRYHAVTTDFQTRVIGQFINNHNQTRYPSHYNVKEEGQIFTSADKQVYEEGLNIKQTPKGSSSKDS